MFEEQSLNNCTPQPSLGPTLSLFVAQQYICQTAGSRISLIHYLSKYLHTVGPDSWCITAVYVQLVGGHSKQHKTIQREIWKQPVVLLSKYLLQCKQQQLKYSLACLYAEPLISAGFSQEIFEPANTTGLTLLPSQGRGLENWVDKCGLSWNWQNWEKHGQGKYERVKKQPFK